MTPERLEAILESNEHSPKALLAIMQDIQGEERWLPHEILEEVASRLDVPISRLYRLATFFKSLSLTPRGETICQVCIGTTCHVRGAPKLVDKFDLELGIKPGETTEDMRFTVETVGCVGACALGPLVVIEGEYHSNMTPDRLAKVIKKTSSRRAKERA
jgi:NADH-quinone oxidoreductase subunit E